MPAAWNNKKYQASLTSQCLQPPKEAELQELDTEYVKKDAEILFLLKQESSLAPLPDWARQIVHQVAVLPAMGWAMPHCIEAICQNIGVGDPERASPSARYRIGPHRLGILADYAICLEGWLKEHSPETISARTSENSLGWRDWEFIARRIRNALGAPEGNKTLLVRRLLARMKFWLRASKAAEEQPNQQAYATRRIAETNDDHRVELGKLDRQIRQKVPHGQRWLELIDSTWPGATRIFHYIERMLIAIGEMQANPDAQPDELIDVNLAPSARSPGGFRSAEAGRRLYETVLRVLDDYLDDALPPAADSKAPIDAKWGERLAQRLGQQTPVGIYLTALARKRMTSQATRSTVAGSR